MVISCSDDEIVFLIRAKHEGAWQYLSEKMHSKQDRMIYKFLYMHRYCGLDYSDLKIVALQTLLLAIESYHPKKNVFDAYYHFLLQRELTHEFKKFSSDHHVMINTAISLDYEIEDGSVMAELIGHDDERLIATIEDPIHQLLEEDHSVISVQEKAILAYVKLGFSFTEIGRVMKQPYRQISKTVKRLIHAKMK